MNKQNLAKFIKGVGMNVTKHSPEILTAIGVVSMVTATVLAVKATPKALKLIEEREAELELQPDEKLTPVETVKVAWKPYVPVAVTCVFGAACLIGSNSVHAKRNAALATAYKLSTTALNEYRDKVVETIGEKKEKTVRDAIAKDKIEKNPVTSSTILVTGNGNSLMYDSISGRYFESSIDKVRAAENEVNGRMIDGMEMYMSLNEFYDELSLEHIPVGDDLGWTVNRRVKVGISSQVAKDGRPCLVLDYLVPPEHGYRDLY